jgi:hypothetical protein
MRMDCVRKRMPALFRRGCAEKRISWLRKTLAQTLATRRIMPAWAITAVPGERLVMVEWEDDGDGTDDYVVIDGFSFGLGGISWSAQEGFVFS